MERTNNEYNSRNRPYFITPQVHIVFHGTESISYLGPEIWDIAAEEFKSKKSLISFKESIKMWVPTNCPCRVCKVYLYRVGFISRI